MAKVNSKKIPAELKPYIPYAEKYGETDIDVRENLVENAAKYGHGRVFVTVDPPAMAMVNIQIEDDGPGIPEALRAELFTRGTRLDTTGKPGTGLGLAIVRDVAEIYGGEVSLSESEDLGGLMIILSLPEAPQVT